MAGYVKGSAEHKKFLYEKWIEYGETGDGVKAGYFLGELLKYDPQVVNIMQTAMLSIKDYIDSLSEKES